ncbi:hypothetical protein BV22DRAFT_926697 [Leucogyrophana mollusca]|uniref:Uncharacterized protein n=1 Tax=Leucogyrophana mollusca TaxID=85980 RepID=A0ACB8AX70_9AGAM|nr:hypothetical protein BV22DRAFT_926697 [Leucogyrophana mollusca]
MITRLHDDPKKDLAIAEYDFGAPPSFRSCRPQQEKYLPMFHNELAADSEEARPTYVPLRPACKTFDGLMDEENKIKGLPSPKPQSGRCLARCSAGAKGTIAVGQLRRCLRIRPAWGERESLLRHAPSVLSAPPSKVLPLRGFLSPCKTLSLARNLSCFNCADHSPKKAGQGLSPCTKSPPLHKVSSTCAGSLPKLAESLGSFHTRMPHSFSFSYATRAAFCGASAYRHLPPSIIRLFHPPATSLTFCIRDPSPTSAHQPPKVAQQSCPTSARQISPWRLTLSPPILRLP